LLLSVVLAWSSVAAADCPFGWRAMPAIPNVQSTVEAITTWDADGAGPNPPLLVVGGSTEIATDEYVGSVAMWNGSTWTLLGTGMNDQVKALTVYNGVLIAGGLFTVADGNTVNYIAWWDGLHWNSVGGGVAAPFSGPGVLAFDSFNGMLVVGGRFNSAGGAAGFLRVACWDGTNWHKLHNGFNAGVGALTVFNGELVAGGGFTTASGAPAGRIARWTGTVWQSLPDGPVNGVDHEVHALAVYNNELVAGGWFTTAGSVSVNRIAKWNGSDWSDLGGGVTGGSDLTVNALCVYDGKLIVGGKFLMAGSQSVSNIAQWDGSGWQAFGGFNQRVDALALSNADLVAGGFFTVGDDSSHVARWLPDCLPGDMNCDLELSLADVPLFIDALLTAPAISSCDAHIANMNGDVHSDGTQQVDGADIALFVQAMVNP
jgi:hypothetical protein